MEKKRSGVLLAAAIVSTIVLCIGLFAVLFTGDALAEQLKFAGFEEGSAEFEAQIRLTKIFVYSSFVSAILSTIWLWSAYGSRKPVFALLAGIVAVFGVLGNLLSLVTAILSFIGYSKQKKLNREYELLSVDDEVVTL